MSRDIQANLGHPTKDSLHTVNVFTEVADKFSSRVLEEAESVLVDRERRAEKTAGTDGWDVQMLLRQVTRV